MSADVYREERGGLSSRVSLLRSGAGDTRFLLLHGVPTNAELWRPLMQVLGDEVEALAPDLPGFGRSDPPDNPSIGAYHRFITRLVSERPAGDTVLVGHDLGGLYALTWALANPGTLRGLVLLNTTIYPNPWVALGLVPLLAPGFGEAYAWLAGGRYRRMARAELRGMYPPGVPEDVLERLLEPYGEARPWLSLVRALRGLNPYRVLTWKRRMGELDLPVLVLWGEGDPYFPASVPERLHRDLPSSRLEYVPGGGHFLMLKHPELVARLITEFTDQL